MARDDFKPICETDTKELRKSLGLPVTKDLVYYKEFNWDTREVFKIIAYEPVFDYPDSTSKTVRITLENGEIVKIHNMYLAEMQSFKGDMHENIIIEGKKITKCPKDYVLYDVETTGTNHNHDKIIEISAIKCKDGKVVDEFSRLIAVDKMLSKKIIKLTGITDELLCSEGVSEEEAYKEFFDFVEGSVLVGHNIAAFDNYFIGHAAEKISRNFIYTYFDTLPFARKVLKDLKSHKLELLSEYFGVSYEGAHRALQDCKINNEIYLRLAKLSGTEIASVEVETYEIVNSDIIFDGLVEQLNDICEKYVEDLKLPPKGLVIRNNNNENVPSVSVCVNEPPYPISQSELGKIFVLTSLVLMSRPNTKKDADKITVTLNNPDDIDRLEVPKNTIIKPQYKAKTEEIVSYVILFDENDNSIVEYIKELILIVLKRYRTKESTFGCCSQFNKCSAAGKCLHINKLYSTACAYRRNLEDGKIFYGENANV